VLLIAELLAEDRDIVLPRPSVRPPRPRGADEVGDLSELDRPWSRVMEFEEDVGGIGGRFLREKRLNVRFCAGLAMAYWYSCYVSVVHPACGVPD
jgi:hypothetical protein